MNGPCQDIQAQILDAALGHQDLQQSLLDHIESCPDCAQYQRDINQQIQSLTSLGHSIEVEMPTRLKRCLAAVEQVPQGRMSYKRRKRMIPLFKLSLAAIIAIAIGLTTLVQPPSPEPSYLDFLAQVHAAENAWFSGQRTVYIRNEITVYPTSTGHTLGFTWLPMCSMKADGQLRMDQLKLSVTDEPYTVFDQAWYDPTTGRFVRQLETDQDLVFANAFDGNNVYTTEITTSGIEIQSQPVTGEFSPPSEPAQFFGLGTGFKSGLDQDSTRILDHFPSTLPDGTAVQVFQLGTPDPDGNISSYCLFRIRTDNHTIDEMEFLINNETQLLERRVTTDYVAAPEVSWDLSELATRIGQTSQENRVTLTPDMVIDDVTIQHIIDKATFETYVLTEKPAWCETMKITDVLDPTSPGQRMFMLTCRAPDKRHVVLVQSHIFNQTFGMLAKMGNKVYESPNGFKVIGGVRSKWMANILLESAQHELKDPPSKDRISYILESPAGTFPILAINGPVTDDELHSLIDSLKSAQEYLEKTEP